MPTICSLNNNAEFEITELVTGKKQIIKGYKMTIGRHFYSIWGRNFWSYGFVIAEYS